MWWAVLRGYSHPVLLGWDLPHARRTPHPLDLGYSLEVAPFWVSGGQLCSRSTEAAGSLCASCPLPSLYRREAGRSDWALEVRGFEMQMLLPRGHSHIKGRCLIQLGRAPDALDTFQSPDPATWVPAEVTGSPSSSFQEWAGVCGREG